MISLQSAENALKSFYLDAVKETLDLQTSPLLAKIERSSENVFGKDVKEREVYIKIMLGCAGSQTICISFHIAEYPLSYPFKTVEE